MNPEGLNEVKQRKLQKINQQKLVLQLTMQLHPRHIYVPRLVPFESGNIENFISMACCLFPSVVRPALSGLWLCKVPIHRDGASSCNHDFYSQVRENASLSSLVYFFFRKKNEHL